MKITVNITDTAPVPRVLNVRQYSTGVDKVNFIVTGCSITGEVSACIKGNELMQGLTVSRQEDVIQCLWEIASDFTQKSGCYDIQLRLTSGANVWVSDRLLLIVSQSTDGSISVGGSELINYPETLSEGIVDQDITGTAFNQGIDLHGYVTKGLRWMFDGETKTTAPFYTGWENLADDTGRVYSFTGSEDRQEMSFGFNGSTCLRTGTAIDYDNPTIEVVFKPSKLTSGDLVNTYESGGYGITISNYAPCFTYYLSNIGYKYVLGTTVLSTDNMCSVSVSFDGDCARLYQNGEKYVNLMSGTIRNNGTPLEIGRNSQNTTSSNYFEGEIYCIRIYDRALTEAEILANLAIDMNRFDIDDRREYIPEGMPYGNGLTAYFDFTDYQGESLIYNPCNYGNLLTVTGGQGNGELILQGTSSSYAILPTTHTRESFAIYFVVKGDEFVDSSTSGWGGLFANSGDFDDYNCLKIVSMAGEIALDGYNSMISSTASVQQYNVIAIASEGENIALYINGIKIGSGDKFNVGSYITLGCGNNNGTLREYYNSVLRFKNLTVCNSTHTEEQIMANSQWLAAKYIDNAEE